MLRAHDPGLSSLDVNVNGDAISLSLSMAAPDVASLVNGEADEKRKLSELARDAIRLSLDGNVVRTVLDGVTDDGGGARVQMSYAIGQVKRPRRLTIASEVPARMARGHRELMVVTFENRVIAETLLDSDSGPVTIELEGSPLSAARSASRFLELGLRHILAGYDHLVFLAGLLLAARGVRELVIALTAFTAAHSISLALVVIGGFHAPPSIVEPLIAASIAWVGIENLLHRGHGTRWIVVFGFGLIHGFGFAGALMELGFGSSAIEMALALLSFNAGLEAGQLAAAAAMFPLIWMMRMRPLWRARFQPCCSAMIVMAGGYWLIERVL